MSEQLDTVRKVVREREHTFIELRKEYSLSSQQALAKIRKFQADANAGKIQAVDANAAKIQAVDVKAGKIQAVVAAKPSLRRS